MFSNNFSGGGAIYSRTATSSTIAVGPDEVITIFTKRNTCTSRTISTTGVSEIMLSFHANITPTALIGIIQGASTTKEYENENYGCGVVTAFASASTTITKMENVY